MRLICVLLTTLVAAAETGSEYQRSIEKFRADREATLKADDGWLTVVGLEWLKEGANRIERVGVITVKSGKAWLGSQELLPDTSPKPTVVSVGRIKFHVIEREGKLGVRIKDNDSAARKHFTGLKWYPVDASWHVRAKFVKWPAPKTIVFDTAVGVKEPMQSPGYVAFQRDGKEYRLDPVEEDGELFFVMRDATSGKTTYAASRFLYAPLAKDGYVDLDFNKAENPPCVFTDYATCPLPPPQNRLTLAVTAGELMYKH
jgi:uncharacterized protein (DUF1684 family)